MVWLFEASFRLPRGRELQSRHAPANSGSAKRDASESHHCVREYDIRGDQKSKINATAMFISSGSSWPGANCSPTCKGLILKIVLVKFLFYLNLIFEELLL